MSSSTTEHVDVLREGDRRVWQRHPGDIARLVWRSSLLALFLAVTALVPTALRNVSADLIQLFALIPDPILYALTGIAQIVIVVLPLLTLAWLVTRRSMAAALMVAGSATISGLLMMLLTDWLNRAAPPADIDNLTSASFISAGFPSSALVAALVAGAATASPLMTKEARRLMSVAVATAVLARVLTATQAPVNLAVTVAVGSVVGSAVLVAIGSPRRRPGAATLRTALGAAGVGVDDLRDEEAHSGRRSYIGSRDGSPIRVIYLDRDDRDADLLAAFIRAVRVHTVDEERISLQPERRVEHEALVTLLAAQAGVRVPVVIALASIDRDSAVIALEAPLGLSLIDADAGGGTGHEPGNGGVSDSDLDDVWRQLGLLHEARIAHGSLTADNLVVGGGTATLTGLENAHLTASDEQCAVDVAELLVSTSLVVGTERAVDAAMRTATAAELMSSLAFVQPAALPTATRRAARKPRGFVDDVRTELEDRLGVDDVELAPLERISIAKAVSWIGFAVLAFFLLTLISSWGEISEAMSGIDWVWVLPILIATVFGTVGGALSLSGSVVRRIPLAEATVVMFGQSFLNRFTPMNAGGMAMRIRYLQKGGTDITVATAAIGLTSAASGVMQVLFFGFFFLWSSSDPAKGLSTGGGGGPAASIVIVVAAAVLIAGATIALTPKFRRWFVAFIRSTLSKIRKDFGELARRPGKMALLFGGAGLGKLATIVAFVFSCRAFDIDIPFAELGALYLVGTTIASTVPTPGGVGAVEAALVFALTNAGVPDATAWAAVLLFRLLNYWFPTIPGYLALRYSEHRELV